MVTIGRVSSQGSFAAMPVRDTHGVSRQSQPDESVARAAEAVAAQVELVNETLRNMSVRLRFQVSKENHTVVILILDAETGELIRKIPPDYFVTATQDFAGTAGQAGLFFGESA